MSVETQEGDPESTLGLYRKAIEVRGEFLVDDDDLEWLDEGDDVVAFRRGRGVICMINYGSESTPLPDGEVLVTSGALTERSLPPDTAVWIKGS